MREKLHIKLNPLLTIETSGFIENQSVQGVDLGTLKVAGDKEIQIILKGSGFRESKLTINRG